jgi:hypothetical protein
MRNALTALISAASFCAIASAASAQVAVYPYPYSSGAAPTVADTTGAPLYGYRQTPAQPAVVGSCDIIAGNRVCTSGQMGPSYGYGYGGPVGMIMGAPIAVVAAPFTAFGMTGANTVAPATGTAAYSYESHVPPQPGAVGHCDLISGNRICTMP